MRKVLPAVLSFLAVGAWAQPAIKPPQVGFMQDRTGSVRPVYGVAGNFLLGQQSATGVVSAAFSGSFGWVKTDSAIIVTDSTGQAIATADAPEGPALFAFGTDGNPALAYLLRTSALLRWNGVALVSVPLDWPALAADAMLSIAEPDPDHAVLIVQRQDGVWRLRIVLTTGSVDSQTALPGLTAPTCMLANGDVVSSDTDGLVVQKVDGPAVHITAQLPDFFSLQQMGHGWLQLRDLANAEEFAVRLSQDRGGFYALPEVTQ